MVSILNDMSNLPSVIDKRKITLDTLELLEGKAREQAAMIILNRRPPAKWLKVHNGVKYLPKQRVEELLRKLFGSDTYFEVKRYELVGNAMTCHGTLHYTWFDGTPRKADGLGAARLQLNAGANPTDMSQLKANAVELCIGKAKTMAKKNASSEIGSLFRAEDDDKYVEFEADTNLLSTAIEAAKHFDNND